MPYKIFAAWLRDTQYCRRRTRRTPKLLVRGLQKLSTFEQERVSNANHRPRADREYKNAFRKYLCERRQSSCEPQNVNLGT
jgi:hypothetical protein